MNKNIVIGIIVVVIGGYFVFSGDKTKINEVVNNTPEVQNETSINEIQTGEQTSVQEVIAESVGSYVAYSQDKIAMAETGDVVLFFHASWCPSCRALNSDIEKNLNMIPAGVTILKTDYDKEVELKKKYGVTSQHTLVQVDKNGNLIKKWSGGSKLESLISQIQ